MDKEQCGVCGKELVKGVDYMRVPSDMCAEHGAKLITKTSSSALMNKTLPSCSACSTELKESEVGYCEKCNPINYISRTAQDFEENPPEMYVWKGDE